MIYLLPNQLKSAAHLASRRGATGYRSGLPDPFECSCAVRFGCGATAEIYSIIHPRGAQEQKLSCYVLPPSPAGHFSP
jgi:hypothetical protein